MIKTWTKYQITEWKWNAGTNEYDPVILAIYDCLASAREAYDDAILSNDVPQIDLSEIVYDKKGCQVSNTMIDRKD